MSLTKRISLAAMIVGVLAVGGAYRYVTSGGLIARQVPGPLETSATRWALNVSDPAETKNRKIH